MRIVGISRFQPTSLFKFGRFYSIRIRSLNCSIDDNNLSEIVKKVPQNVGSGPFSERNRSNLLNVSLPASGEIFMRKGSIVAANGSSLTDLSIKTTTSESLVEMARISPVIYQKITSISPTSLLISAKDSSTPTSITILDITKDDSWIIAQRKCILGWTSSSVNVKGHSGYKQWGNVIVNGAGQLALIGEGELYEIEVSENENISLNPSNLIAYKTLSSGKFIRLAQTRLSFDIPILSNQYGKSIVSFFNKPIFQRIKMGFRWLFSKENIVFEINGPATIVVQSQGRNIKKVLDKEEIKEIIEKS